MKQLLSLLLLVSITAFMSCKGDQGDQGPAGTNGLDGNANVKSVTIPITSANWVSISADQNLAELSVPLITQAIADNGMVMVYFKTTYLGLDGNTWTALPFSLARSGYTEAFSFAVQTGKVFITETASDNLPVEPAGTIRVIVATADGMATAPVDWSNYQDVKDYLQLAD